MIRLGELLLKLGKITQPQLEDALRAQVMWGARLGTNLIEIANLDLDMLSQTLGRQQQIPPAIRKHFESADGELQAKLPRNLASRWECIPIAAVAGNSQQVAIAVVAMPPPHALDEIAEALGSQRDKLVVGIACELRVRYQLERVYGIERDSRFLRVRGGRITEPPPIPPPPAPGDASDAELEIARESRAPSRAGILLPDEPPPEPAQLHAPWATSAPSAEQEPVADEPDERRRFVRTVAEDTTPLFGILGRVAVHKMAVTAAVEGEHSPQPSTLSDCLRAIRRAQDRDRVGDLIIDILIHHAIPDLDAGGVFVVRGNIAVGWKGFCRGENLAIDSIAIPLEGNNIFASAHSEAFPQRIETSSTTLSDVDRRFLASLGGAVPRYVVVTPVAMGDHVLCMIYGHGQHDLDQAIELVDSVAAAAQSAFARLMRAAQR